MILFSDPYSMRFRFGLVAFVLGFGDSFHLFPRIYAMWSAKANNSRALGIGKAITSVTMTVFYIGLWFIGLYHYNINFKIGSVIIITLAILRVILSIMPQNRWTSENPPMIWSVLRNIPFLIIGILVTVIFAMGGAKKSDSLEFLWIAVIISFACYLPVILFSKHSSKVGMLMLPKSCAYFSIVLMGFTLPSV